MIGIADRCIVCGDIVAMGSPCWTCAKRDFRPFQNPSQVPLDAEEVARTKAKIEKMQRERELTSEYIPPVKPSDFQRLGAKVADISQRLIVSEISAHNRMDSISRKVTLLTVAVTILALAVIFS